MDEKWYDGTISLSDDKTAGSTMNALVCVSIPGIVMYSVAPGLTYAVPTSRVTEVTMERTVERS